MSDQPDLFPETVKRPRGRPKKPNALTGAERMRRLREKAATVLYAPEAERDGQALADLSDTALCELVREPLRAGQPLALAEVVAELVNRANGKQAKLSPDRESVRLARWVNGGWYELTGQDKSCHVTKNPEIPTDYVDMDNGHVTKNEATVDQGEAFTLPSLVPDLAMSVEPKPSRSSASHVDQGKGSREYPVEPVASKPSASKGSREYPAETKARAVLAYKQGMKARDVRALIKAECGEDPDSNLAKNIRAWEQQAAVVEILATLETEHCKTQ